MSRDLLGSTYRMQLPGVGFAGARAQVAYLHELGIETLYVSPVLAAVPASKHGYDVIDPTRLDPDLGTAEELEALLAELSAHGMRLLVDIVPNHMATHPANRWWWEVMRDGEHSELAATFDIDWAAQRGRVLVPTLSRPLAQASEQARILAGEEGPVLELDGQLFPLATGDHAAVDVRALIGRQHYRPSYWRLSRHEINYRRFFDIDGLIGVRVEDPVVFARTHRFIVELCADERLAGVRVDHIDGLSDPARYLQCLASALEEAEHRRVVLVEKILARGEALPAGWAVDGTTGYEFADVAGGLFVDGEGARLLAELGAELTGEHHDFAELSLAAKRELLAQSFPAPLEALGRRAIAAVEADEPGQDLSLAEVSEALAEMTVRLDVYRSYLDGSTVSPADRATVAQACTDGDLTPQVSRARGILERGMLERALTDTAWLEVARRWQQLTGAVMAKGVEDTACYRYSGLVSHAEVGSDPDRPSAHVEDLDFLARSHRRRSSSLNATSTHDSKRNEDARARLYVLSEAPREWSALVRRWHRRHGGAGGHGPDAHDEILAYQTLLALWVPGAFTLARPDRERAKGYAVKAAREAKRRTNWLDPDQRYEKALTAFVTRLLGDEVFAKEMGRFVARIGPAAATNSLGLVVLKTVMPGVPDFYQGTELFEPTLTDPDNRRPVDYGKRRQLLAALPCFEDPASDRDEVAGDICRNWPDGRLKLLVIRALLHLRRREPRLFDGGSYERLEVAGRHAGHVVALARRDRRRLVVALVPRLVFGLAGPGRFPTGRAVWGDTTLRLPSGADRELVDVITGKAAATRREVLAVGEILEPLPVAVLATAT